MSAFNQIRYNLARYNIPAAQLILASGDARVSFVFKNAQQIYLAKGIAEVKINAESLNLDRGYIAAGSASENFTATSKVNGYFWINGNAQIFFGAAINLSQDILAIGHGTEEFQTAVNLSQDVLAFGASVEILESDHMISQDIHADGDSGEVFTSTSDVVSLAEYICSFPNLVLKPGQVLIIDAGSYNVLLDGENAIHLQQGDWLDELNRNTQSITISATGISRVTAEILYTERYL